MSVAVRITTGTYKGRIQYVPVSTASAMVVAGNAEYFEPDYDQVLSEFHDKISQQSDIDPEFENIVDENFDGLLGS